VGDDAEERLAKGFKKQGANIWGEIDREKKPAKRERGIETLGAVGGDGGGGGRAGVVHRERDQPHVQERDPVRGCPLHHQHRGVQHRAQER